MISYQFLYYKTLTIYNQTYGRSPTLYWSGKVLITKIVRVKGKRGNGCYSWWVLNEIIACFLATEWDFPFKVHFQLKKMGRNWKHTALLNVRSQKWIFSLANIRNTIFMKVSQHLWLMNKGSSSNNNNSQRKNHH